MLNTKIKKPDHEGESWDWAVANGRLLRVFCERGSNKDNHFDLLLLGQADYVAINVDAKGLYNKHAPLRLFSVNGEFRMWVEQGLHQEIRGVRWEVKFDSYEDAHHKPHWNVTCSQMDRLAIERIMGEITDSEGHVL